MVVPSESLMTRGRLSSASEGSVGVMEATTGAVSSFSSTAVGFAASRRVLGLAGTAADVVSSSLGAMCVQTPFVALKFALLGVKIGGW